PSRRTLASLAPSTHVIQQIRILAQHRAELLGELLALRRAEHLELAAHADEHDLGRETRVLAQRGRNQHATLLVGLTRLRFADIDTLENRASEAEAAVLRLDLVDEVLPGARVVSFETRNT